MKKYLELAKVTFNEYFVYRLNFLLWRFRAVVTLFVLYFLWLAAIPSGKVFFGYDQAKILTYILGTSLVRSLVLASVNTDVAGEIVRGDISNYLIKPISYIKYWFTKDLVDKLLNFFFSIIEILLIIKLFNPPIILQENILILLAVLIATTLGIFLNFFISFLLSTIAFWTPENPWPIRFLFSIILDFLAGGAFPLDILPTNIYKIVNLLPFPYLVYFPIKIYLGNLSPQEIYTGFVILIFWIMFCYFLLKKFFKLGLKSYAGWGR